MRWTRHDAGGLGHSMRAGEHVRTEGFMGVSIECRARGMRRGGKSCAEVRLEGQVSKSKPGQARLALAPEQ